MFQAAKGFKKEDLILVANEIGETVPSNITITGIKDLILESKEYQSDPDFVKELLITTVSERKLLEEERKLNEKKLEEERKLNEKKLEEERIKEERKLEEERIEKERKFELEKKKLDLELAKVNVQVPNQTDVNVSIPLNSVSQRKFTLPKLQFRQFGDNIKDWLPFWSQFEKIDKDEEIAPEDKFQYLIQATVLGSRSREVVESFPPTSANYSKAVESLKARFGREDMLVEVYVRELLKLIISVQIKERFSLTFLYDRLESYLRALETLGVTTDKCASILYPMVESCFPEDFLKAWNRNSTSSSKTDAKERLTDLMLFLKTEVEGEERINMAMAGFGLLKSEDTKLIRKRSNNEVPKHKIPTASALLTNSAVQDAKKLCIFCDGKHLSSECFSARKMSLLEKQNVLKQKRCCFACLTPGHMTARCRVFVKCLVCGKKHVTLMCHTLDVRNKSNQGNEEKSTEKEVILTNLNKCPRVLLQTLRAKLFSDNEEKDIRILLDTGSQKSYILKDVAEEMKYHSHRQESVIHSLFGGVTSRECQHNCYKIRLANLDTSYKCNFEALDQTVICENILPVGKGPWLDELKKMDIVLSDVTDTCESSIQVLIGADIIGKLLTGRREVLSSGLVAMETYLGWTLMGKVPQPETKQDSLAMTVTSLFVKEAEIADLWRLDLIGIKDPMEIKSKSEKDRMAKEHFLETVHMNSDNRYEVHLPWTDDSIPLPDNLSLAKKRLHTTTSKLVTSELYDKYENILQSWIGAGIVEEVPTAEVNSQGHYLPHRPVIKEQSSTTPIRPVFDASARMQNHPSLNQCLESGPNLIELIPDILLKFRQFKYGIIADIEKAFLQINVKQSDRDYLRFLWWDEEKQLKIYRHTRVVFGLKCSPFLLGAVIEYHLSKHCQNSPDDQQIVGDLQNSFYVDNVVTSLNTKEELDKFISVSHKVMACANFNLRDWQFTGDQKEGDSTTVLGQVWNRQKDTLSISMNWITQSTPCVITKRTILSVAHRVFDPFGFTSPVMLCPKRMLQETWKMRMKWDEEITGPIRNEFLKWFEELPLLGEISIPRWVCVTPDNLDTCSIHTFCDASKDAYAAVVYLRVATEEKTEVFLLASKSQVSPLKGGTIPRLELMAALVGIRLTRSVIEALGWKEINCYYWSDSTTVLTWITRDENWSVFVRNRVQEIKMLSQISSWNHIPGESNPADLPSRGCRAKHLLSLKWWEGPPWMKLPIEKWPCNVVNQEDIEAVEKEKMKSNVLISTCENKPKDWYYKYFSKYEQIIRLVGWVLRFMKNCLCPIESRIKGELTSYEYQGAEKRVIQMIQTETFSQEHNRLKSLDTYIDDHGIMRLRTKIINRNDHEDFRKPMILPPQHEVVQRLILSYHKKNSHAGVQILLNILREQFWILNGRKTIRKVLAKCTTCRRYTSKSLDAATASLPENRVCDATVFQIIGVDMAGPLYLKGNLKTWVIIFTCAVYRAVHFELITSLSTECFLLALRRFIARRGRCSTIYCDNGTNFVGAANILNSLDWNEIVKQSAVNAIQWKFNPPAAPWWGGFWERLIRLLKDLLKREVGRACLAYEEMITVLCDCESLINARPLTYLAEKDSELMPISPSMFLQDIKEWRNPDLETADHRMLNNRIKYRHTLQKALRNRFRSEYLGLLIHRPKRKAKQYEIAVGQVVLVGSDSTKRINWPLGRVIELMPGKDGIVRLVKLQTAHSILLRPIQPVYPLEVIREDLPSDTPLVQRDLQVDTDNHDAIELVADEEKAVPKVTRFGEQLEFLKE